MSASRTAVTFSLHSPGARQHRRSRPMPVEGRRSRYRASTAQHWRMSKRARKQHLETGAGFGLTDYIMPVPVRRPSRRRPDDTDLVVTDDWPDIVPITDQELRIVEGHFADLLDKWFGPRP